ncbi:MAG: hypothetical protein Q3972_02275 [Corynebacterium sp.]|nr:hypothetical protein [Corynebacterium sp.]
MSTHTNSRLGANTSATTRATTRGALRATACVAIALLTGTLMQIGTSRAEDSTTQSTATQADSTQAAFCNTTEYEPYVEYMGTQLLYFRPDTGRLSMSANAKCPRYALSLAKLYIADYVIRYGDEDEAEQAEYMVAHSDDDLAAEFYEKYPESIDVIATEYGLEATQGQELWGNAVTSAFDIAEFIAAKLAQEAENSANGLEDPSDPVLRAMRNMSDMATDGYPQDFGTTILPGAQGTKLGWSNDETMHSSVTFGTDSQGHPYIAVVSVFGDSIAATRAARQFFTGLVA